MVVRGRYSEAAADVSMGDCPAAVLHAGALMVCLTFRWDFGSRPQDRVPDESSIVVQVEAVSEGPPSASIPLPVDIEHVVESPDKIKQPRNLDNRVKKRSIDAAVTSVTQSCDDLISKYDRTRDNTLERKIREVCGRNHVWNEDSNSDFRWKRS
ncbi:hypothetical protein [Telmatospirillum sp.]|uniref:hypothetical protein n=1 Tax=Telmatospirillum sp. TaxID=2079197 RepID=UPI00285151DC|nr:hypothetical protein [Telmatospirillum sp.]MDR3441321.1 hypothetical protein [Telmatospirillum sp.]